MFFFVGEGGLAPSFRLKGPARGKGPPSTILRCRYIDNSHSRLLLFVVVHSFSSRCPLKPAATRLLPELWKISENCNKLALLKKLGGVLFQRGLCNSLPKVAPTFSPTSPRRRNRPLTCRSA